MSSLTSPLDIPVVNDLEAIIIGVTDLNVVVSNSYCVPIATVETLDLQICSVPVVGTRTSIICNCLALGLPRRSCDARPFDLRLYENWP